MKILKMIGLSVAGLILLLIITTTLVLSCAPQFGKTYGKKKKQAFQSIEHYQDGKFVNLSPTSMDLKYIPLIREQLKKDPSRSPARDLTPQAIDSLQIVNRAGSGTYVSWLGHSAVLLELDSQMILLDPMLGESPSPFNFLGPSRYSSELAISIEKLPVIDILIISHDHYDHLDYQSIKKLKDKVRAFFVPLGVGTHLEKWGVSSEKITEMNWWDTANNHGINLIFTPARHFSGRGILDRNKTLWGSWVIKGKDHSLYFSGDGGYDDHFAEIGDKYGPFDLVMMECGQYNLQWRQIHMMPEETAQAAQDLGAKLMMPIHWGAFTLALHSWTDPVVRVKKQAEQLGIEISTPYLGESFRLQDSVYPSKKWWKEYQLQE